jgi:hypothetical protein
MKTAQNAQIVGSPLSDRHLTAARRLESGAIRMRAFDPSTSLLAQGLVALACHILRVQTPGWVSKGIDRAAGAVLDAEPSLGLALVEPASAETFPVIGTAGARHLARALRELDLGPDSPTASVGLALVALGRSQGFEARLCQGYPRLAEVMATERACRTVAVEMARASVAGA